MLTRAQKEQQVADLQEKVNRSTGMFLVDYRGLSVSQLTELRCKVRGDDGTASEYRVIKNSIIRRAVEGTGSESVVDLCVGPTALAISYDDPVGIAKALVDFAKDNEELEVKGGVLSGNALDAAEVAKLATLPSLLELRGKLAGLIQAPASKLARLLNEPGGQLARLVSARQSALEEGGEG